MPQVRDTRIPTLGTWPDAQVPCLQHHLEIEMNDVKLLPLPARLAEYGLATRTLWESYARACIEADRKARPDGGEAVAWRRRHPSENEKTGWHGWILSEEEPSTKYPGSEYQRLYTHPAPDDVARLVESANRMIPTDVCLGNWNVPGATEVPLLATVSELRAMKSALAPFTAAQQEVQS